MLKVSRVVTEVLEANTYLVYNEQNQEALIIDPGSSSDKIRAEIKNLQLKPLAVLITHGHCDHIGALEDIRQYYQIPV